DGGVVRGRVVLDGNLRRHATHGGRAAAVAGLDQRQRIGAQERRSHGDLAAGGENDVLVGAGLLDGGEDVVPAADVEAGRVILQLPQDFVHLERGENGLDQYRSLDGTVRHAQFLLCQGENVVPHARFEVRLHLRQVKVRPRAAREQFLRVV